LLRLYRIDLALGFNPLSAIEVLGHRRCLLEATKRDMNPCYPKLSRFFAAVNRSHYRALS
jgi:hypothetical protein